MLRVGQVGGGDEAAEVGVALPSLGQEYEVVGGGWEGHRLRLGGGRGAGGGSVYRRADRGAVTLGAGPICGDAWAEERLYLYFSSIYGFDPVFGAGFGEADDAVEPIVVGEGQGGLAECSGAGHELLNATAAVEEREVGVYV